MRIADVMKKFILFVLLLSSCDINDNSVLRKACEGKIFVISRR